MPLLLSNTRLIRFAFPTLPTQLDLSLIQMLPLVCFVVALSEILKLIIQAYKMSDDGEPQFHGAKCEILK